MRKPFAIIGGVIAMVIALLAIYAVARLEQLGAFSDISRHFEGSCEVLAAVPGPEALQLDAEEQVLYFISNHHCAGVETDAAGAIYSIDLKAGNTLREITSGKPEDFHPHGLSFYRDKNHRRYLFVNNHRADGSHTVETFELTDNGGLFHRSTITDRALVSPNDLVAVGSDQFYVTNDGRSHSTGSRILDTFFQRNSGNIVYYDGKKGTIVARDLNFPNGIALDHTEGLLWVGETLSGKIKVYKMHPEKRTLRFLDEQYLGTGIDNISIDNDQDLWIAVHPNLLALSRHKKNLSHQSPSQVFRVVYKPSPFSIREVYANEGNELSGASAVIHSEGVLFIGSVCETKLLKCVCSDQELP